MTKIVITLEPHDEAAREWIATWLSKLVATAHARAINADIQLIADETIVVAQITH